MPLIQIGDENGTLSEADAHRLWALMAYPRDAKSRNQLIALLRLNAAAVLEAELLEAAGSDIERRNEAFDRAGLLLAYSLKSVGGLQALVRAPGIDEAVKGWYAKAWPGSIAGDVLSYMLQMEVTGYAQSVNKAVVLEIEYLKNATSADGRGGPGSNRYIRDSWETFKPVAHLWLTFRAWQFSSEDPRTGAGGTRFLSPLSLEGLRGFLALSERLAALVTHKPKGNRRAPINPADFWRVPEQVALPPVSFVVPLLEDWALDLLKRYRRKV